MSGFFGKRGRLNFQQRPAMIGKMGCAYWFVITFSTDARVCFLSLFQHGVIIAEDEEYFIEPLNSGANFSGRHENEGSPHVVYKRSSLQLPHTDVACGVLGTHQGGEFVAVPYRR